MVGCNHTLVNYPDTVVQRITRTYLSWLIVSEHLNEGKVEAFDSYRSNIVVIIVLSGDASVTRSIIITRQVIVCWVVVQLGVNVILLISRIVSSIADLSEVINRGARR